ncbi:MAG: hypothetical protein PHQ94_01365 [Syntrophomonas sp.]|nr:hypothetical protein [Syntrophomonas sp.]
MAVQLEKIREDIIGLRPIYTNEGKATIIYLREGEVQDKRGIRSLQLALARLYAIDLGAQRRNMRGRLKRNGVMPFYLANDRVFIPLKMRKVLASNDAVYGYVDVVYMGEAVSSGMQTCLLPLKNGREIEILSKRSTVLQCQHMGQRLLGMLQGDNDNDEGEKLLVDAGIYINQVFRSIKKDLKEIKEIITEDYGDNDP